MRNLLSILLRALIAAVVSFAISALIIFITIKYTLCRPSPDFGCLITLYIGTPAFALVPTALLVIPVYLLLKSPKPGLNIISNYYKIALVVIFSIVIATYLMITFLK